MRSPRAHARPQLAGNRLQNLPKPPRFKSKFGFKPPQAGAFALISEEGIAKGVRRIVAYTASDAKAAIAEGERLAAEVKAAGLMADGAPEFEKRVNELKGLVRSGKRL